MTPAGRSRQYVREICRRIGEDKIELGNACRSVAAKRPKLNTAAAAATAGHEGEEKGEGAEVMVEDSVVEGGGSEGSGEGTDVVEVKVKVKAKEEDHGDEEAGRWEVVDARGKARFFDEVSEREREGDRERERLRLRLRERERERERAN